MGLLDLLQMTAILPQPKCLFQKWDWIHLNCMKVIYEFEIFDVLYFSSESKLYRDFKRILDWDEH